MARTSIALRLVRSPEESPEGVVAVHDRLRWTSPPGGWLAHQSGVWNQLPSGMYLKDAGNSIHVADCLGLIFVTAAIGDSGTAYYPSSGSHGTWTVIDTTNA